MITQSRIVVDAMGGDNAPGAIVEGAVLAAREYGVNIILAGNREHVQPHLNKHSAAGLPITIRHTTEVIGMSDNPLDVVRKKKDSSIRVGMELLAEEKADAFISAGNSGAVVSAGLFVLKRIKGIERPAIATVLPSLKGPFIVADVGANNTCKPHQLAQFAIMCSVYSHYYLKCSKPRVGLISNGEEETKGTETIKQTHALLKESSLNYVGHIEGKDMFFGNVDVAVCDGFTGNILLKSSEAVAESLGRAIKEELQRNLMSKIGYLFSRSAFMQLKKRFDYSEYGGAPLLGVNGPVIICHGRSTAFAIKNAVRAARDFAESKVIYHTLNDIEVNQDIHTIAKKPSFIDRVLKRGKPADD
ncbi:phosphate acyltransferase PlsX [Thermodesulfobacteriota bacterium]